MLLNSFGIGVSHQNNLVAHLDSMFQLSFVQISWSHRSKFLLVPNSPPPPLRLEHPITFNVQRSESSGIWYVTDFVDVHSHPFDKPEHAFVLRSHRGLNPYRSLEGGGSRAGAWWASSIPDHGCHGHKPRWSRRDWISFVGSVQFFFEAEEGKGTRT